MPNSLSSVKYILLYKNAYVCIDIILYNYLMNQVPRFHREIIVIMSSSLFLRANFSVTVNL
jgi:hypothetical protein